MGGIELLNVIRKDPALKFLPIVMLTSSREESDLVTSYELGANAFVVKPVDFEQFIDVIKQIGVFWALINELPPEI
jgi:CheY-like chemotaxis protein